MEQNKIEKKYNNNFKKVVALFNGQAELFRTAKVSNNAVNDIVQELIKEQKETAIHSFKQEVRALLLKKLQFDKDIKNAELELKKTVNTKQAEFNTVMENLFKKVENINEIEKSYYSSLEVVSEINNTDEDSTE